MDRTDVTIVELEPGRRFLERSAMATQQVWEHERLLEPVVERTRITDRLRWRGRFTCATMAFALAVPPLFQCVITACSDFRGHWQPQPGGLIRIDFPEGGRYTMRRRSRHRRSRGLFLEALFFSTAVVALAEMGDKTQLLSFVLAAKLKRKVPIALGILFATLANHSLAGYVGAWLAGLVSPRSAEMDYRRIVFCLRFVGAQAGQARRKPEAPRHRRVPDYARGLLHVEMGDKTQLATVALAARYESLVAVVLGTTLGMMVANVPAVWLGEALAHRVNMKVMRWVAAALFVILGALSLFAGRGSS